jgi:hypothetical protein
MLDFERLAPDVRQSLLAMTAFLYDDDEIEIEDRRTHKTIEAAIRTYRGVFEDTDFQHLTERWKECNRKAWVKVTEVNNG